MSRSRKDMRTPLAKVRGLGSTHEGTMHFWRQRLTAVANIPLFLFFVGFLIVMNGATIMNVSFEMQNLVRGLVLLLAVLADSIINPRNEETSQQGDI